MNRSTLSQILRWTGRVLSVVSIGILLLFFIGEGDFSQPPQLTLKEWLGLLFFPGGIVIGMILGWRRESLGAFIALASLAAFYLIQLVFFGDFPGGPFFLLFTLPALLMGLAGWVSETQRRR